jgi:hypothetical protein
MRKLYHRLLKSLNINGRDFAVLLLALLLAFSIWLLHNLSLKYNDYLSVSVVAHSNLEGYSDVSADRSEVMARCRATGYNVISSNVKGRKKVVDIEFKPSVMRHKSGETFFVTASDLQEYAHLIYGDDVTVEYFVTDTLFFRFPAQDHKKVPVHPVYSVTYRTQYMSSGGFQVEPDSVTLYGEPHRLEIIDRVYTSPIRYSDLDKSNHMNNLHYTDLFMNAFGPEFYEDHDISEYDINYISQGMYGSLLSVYMEQDGDTVYLAAADDEGKITAAARFRFVTIQRSVGI